MSDAMLRAAALIDPQLQANYHIETSINNTYPSHYHDYYEIFVITTGKCKHKINELEQYLEKGSMVFVRPADVHSYDFWGNSDCQFVNINFSSSLVNECFDFFGNRTFEQELKSSEVSPYSILSGSDMDSVIKKSEHILLYSTVDKTKARLLAKSLLVDALTYFFLNDQGSSKKSSPHWFDSLLFQMQKKENFTAGIEKLYSISDKSTGHLNRVFKQYLNTTPTVYINRLKLNYARNLLLTTNMTILEVSFEAGFENLSHFYHLFKDNFGVSPKKIRSN